VRLGDWVEVFEDKSPGRFVESGDGVVLDVKYDAARGGATIEVALVSGNVRVGTKGFDPLSRAATRMTCLGLGVDLL
jgi:ABC-type taurine transport system substrate-binding protein